MATKRKSGADTEKKQRPDRTKQNANLIPFVKGDARINKLGRPRNFDQLRALVQEIGAEKLDNSDLTRIAAKVRQMYASRQSGDNVTLLAYGFGKVKDETAATVDGKLQIEIIRESPNKNTDAPPSATDDQERSEAV